jgi:hypothetical protein
MNKACEQLRCRIDRRVDAEGGALIRCSRKEVYQRVPLIVPKLGDLPTRQYTQLHSIFATMAHLLAVQQHRQVVWHLSLVPHNPCERAVLRL